jgi:hypothetical protein
MLSKQSTQQTGHIFYNEAETAVDLQTLNIHIMTLTDQPRHDVQKTNVAIGRG